MKNTPVCLSESCGGPQFRDVSRARRYCQHKVKEFSNDERRELHPINLRTSRKEKIALIVGIIFYHSGKPLFDDHFKPNVRTI